MELKQKLELRKLLAPELRQSLKILALPILDLKTLVEEEMLDNPVLEESFEQVLPEKKEKSDKDAAADAEGDAGAESEADHPKELPEDLDKIVETLSPDDPDKSTYENNETGKDNDAKNDFAQSLITKKVSLQDVLLRQLGIAAANAEEIAIGEEIIGNIDENGYLRAGLETIAESMGMAVEKIETVLELIQQFDPAGVGARSIPECLLIQLRLAKEDDPLLEAIVRSHLEDVATKNYSRIARALKEPLEKIEPLIQKISRLNPKPGRNYSTEDVQQVIPDIIIEENDEGQLKIIINHENIPRLMISRSYRLMLKDKNLDAQTREFLSNKLRRALELLRAINKRKSTLRMVIETIVEIQQEAIKQDISLLKPLTFREVAERISMHESTVCRVVMNKYCQTPCGVFALKEFFPSKLAQADANGEAVSSELIKSLITDLIAEEDKRHPLSDEDIARVIKEKNSLNVARRTIAKYREELKILSSTYRRQK
ncbi:MAG TPA: RNA polymerase factor sigma-54 [Candidatus Omnitrophota bacterium]|nr:RNA polymerase factor sigma-54 [Candidatus Omnitrophota bacterium]HRZ14822.1 RNA polymerase factor sigma-54 [Candidatus Omnitrophota bacterium]